MSSPIEQRDAREVAVIGAGTMGSGIGLTLARFGWNVTLVSRREVTLDMALERIKQKATVLEATGAMPEASLNGIMERIRTATHTGGVNPDSRLVIESTPEDVASKVAVLSAVEGVVGPECVLTSNTSSLRLDDLSSALERPERFAGFHWFNPPELIPLVEVVPASQTDGSSVQKLVKWARDLGKEPVAVRRDVPGFIANRLQYALLREAYWLLEQGVCSASDVDRVVRHGLGLRWASMGPFESVDFAGLDVHLAVAEALFPLLACADRAPSLLRDAVSRGDLGVKSGKGLLGPYPGPKVGERRAEQARSLAWFQAQGKCGG